MTPSAVRSRVVMMVGGKVIAGPGDIVPSSFWKGIAGTKRVVTARETRLEMPAYKRAPAGWTMDRAGHIGIDLPPNTEITSFVMPAANGVQTLGHPPTFSAEQRCVPSSCCDEYDSDGRCSRTHPCQVCVNVAPMGRVLTSVVKQAGRGAPAGLSGFEGLGRGGGGGGGHGGGGHGGGGAGHWGGHGGRRWGWGGWGGYGGWGYGGWPIYAYGLPVWADDTFGVNDAIAYLTQSFGSAPWFQGATWDTSPMGSAVVRVFVTDALAADVIPSRIGPFTVVLTVRPAANGAAGVSSLGGCDACGGGFAGVLSFPKPAPRGANRQTIAVPGRQAGGRSQGAGTKSVPQGGGKGSSASVPGGGGAGTKGSSPGGPPTKGATPNDPGMPGDSFSWSFMMPGSTGESSSGLRCMLPKGVTTGSCGPQIKLAPPLPFPLPVPTYPRQGIPCCANGALYKVAQGERLSDIAANVGVPPQVLIDANAWKPCQTLASGERVFASLADGEELYTGIGAGPLATTPAPSDCQPFTIDPQSASCPDGWEMDASLSDGKSWCFPMADNACYGAAKNLSGATKITGYTGGNVPDSTPMPPGATTCSTNASGTGWCFADTIAPLPPPAPPTTTAPSSPSLVPVLIAGGIVLVAGALFVGTLLISPKKSRPEETVLPPRLA